MTNPLTATFIFAIPLVVILAFLAMAYRERRRLGGAAARLDSSSATERRSRFF